MARSRETQPIENKVYELAQELEKLALIACENRDINGVHFLVTEQRRAYNLLRSMKNRGILSPD